MSAASEATAGQASAPGLSKRLGAETMAAFALTFVGCSAIMTGMSHVGVALAFGLTLAVMVASTGHISGGHANPAVTIGLASVGRHPWREVPGYVIAQCIGALIAGVLLRLIIGTAADLGTNAPVGETASGNAFVLEIVLTAIFVFVVTSVATDAKAPSYIAGFAIGGTITLLALGGGNVSSASMNPARSLGPALIAAKAGHLWLYILGPIIGGIIGAWISRLVGTRND